MKTSSGLDQGLDQAKTLHQRLRNNGLIDTHEAVSVSETITSFLKNNQHLEVESIKDLLTVVCTALLDEDNTIVKPSGEKIGKTGAYLEPEEEAEEEPIRKSTITRPKRAPLKIKGAVSERPARPVRKGRLTLKGAVSEKTA